jgi:hypothetical protein
VSVVFEVRTTLSAIAALNSTRTTAGVGVAELKQIVVIQMQQLIDM